MGLLRNMLSLIADSAVIDWLDFHLMNSISLARVRVNEPGFDGVKLPISLSRDLLPFPGGLRTGIV